MSMSMADVMKRLGISEDEAGPEREQPLVTCPHCSRWTEPDEDQQCDHCGGDLVEDEPRTKATVKATSNGEGDPWMQYIVRNEDWVTTETPTIPWLLHGILAYEAATVLVGDSRSGKTTWVCKLMRAMCNEDDNFCDIP